MRVSFDNVYTTLAVDPAPAGVGRFDEEGTFKLNLKERPDDVQVSSYNYGSESAVNLRVRGETLHLAENEARSVAKAILFHADRIKVRP